MDASKQNGTQKNTGWLILCLPALITLGMNLLVSALVLQMAEIRRSIAIPDDTMPSSLTDYIHPAALLCLAAGYAISVLIIAGTVVLCARSK